MTAAQQQQLEAYLQVIRGCAGVFGMLFVHALAASGSETNNQHLLWSDSTLCGIRAIKCHISCQDALKRMPRGLYGAAAGCVCWPPHLQ